MISCESVRRQEKTVQYRNVHQRIPDMSAAVGRRVPHSAALHDSGRLATFSSLPPDAVRWRDICYGDVAVCVSVTLMRCAHCPND